MQKTTTADDLSTVKAAAWSWYQRGSGSEGRPIREFDLTRINRAPRYSRFKLEAASTTSVMQKRVNSYIPWPESSSSSESESETFSTRPQESLLDSYEIDRISKQLDSIIEAAGASRQRDSSSSLESCLLGHSDSSPTSSISSSSSFALKSRTMKISRMKFNGFWLLKPVAICGSRGDVVEPSIKTKATDNRRHR